MSEFTHKNETGGKRKKEKEKKKRERKREKKRRERFDTYRDDSRYVFEQMIVGWKR